LFDVVGFMFLGILGVIIGYNNCIVWGFMNFVLDVIDLYFECVFGGCVEYDGCYESLSVWCEIIKVRGGDDVVIIVCSMWYGLLLLDVFVSVCEVGCDIMGVGVDSVIYDVVLVWMVLMLGCMVDVVFEFDVVGDWE